MYPYKMVSEPLIGKEEEMDVSVQNSKLKYTKTCAHEWKLRKGIIVARILKVKKLVIRNETS